MLVLIVVQAHIDAIIHDTIITTNPLERRRGRRNVAWFGRRRWSSHIGVVTPEGLHVREEEARAAVAWSMLRRKSVHSRRQKRRQEERRDTHH